MKIKHFLITAVLATAILCSVGDVKAMTDTERQALIVQLTQQILQLQTQVAQMLAQQQGPGSWCYTFNNNLGYANSGSNEIFNLHIALQKEGISYSPDDISTYSTGTSQAVVQFQAKYGITPQSGFVGLKTRTKLNNLYKCNLNNTTTPTACTPNWQCTDWSICSSGQQTKTCSDYNYCGVLTGMPSTSRVCSNNNNNNNYLNTTNTCKADCITQSDGTYAVSCSGSVTKCGLGKTCQKTYSTNYTYNNGSVQTLQTLTGAQCTTASSTSCTPNWQCGGFSTCANGQQTQTCTDYNNCGVTTGKPALTQSCTTGCTPNWSCTSWGICQNGQQTKSCTDSNNCGVTANKPATQQSCVEVPDVSINANGSPQTLNVFLTLGNGASVATGGIHLSKDINLQWIGIQVASCTASDSKTPVTFSGYKLPSSSETVTLSGDIQNGSSSSSKVSNTYRINCISAQTGNNVSDQVTVNLFYTAISDCQPNWSCGSWSNCSNSRQTKTCTDLNGCGSLVGKPSETQSCTTDTTGCTPNWSCTNWGSCISGQQTKTCTDSNGCGVTTNEPPLTQSCNGTCTPNWSCSGFGSCISGQQTQTCTDSNTCGTTVNEPALTRLCTCVPNWSCGNWSDCENEQQTRACNDIYSCGTTVNEPLLTQSCTICTDSDVTSVYPDGKNYFTKGTVNYTYGLSGGTNTESWTDQCTGINNVIEYYCMPKNANPLVGGGSGPGQGTYACPHGCSNGECNP